MSLTIGSGPLGRGAGAANYTFEAPPHRILFQPYGPRLRALIDDREIFDTTRAHLLYETGIAPVAYVPLQDFDDALLTPSDTSTHCPFKGDASYWSVTVGDRTIDDAVWAYPEPIESAAWLDGYAALAGRYADGWLVENERVRHVRDPFHRVDAHRSSRPARFTAGDAVLAECAEPVLLFETSVPVRAYVPREALRDGTLEDSDLGAHCPYKGDARCWHVRMPDGSLVENAAWSYADPAPGIEVVKGLVCLAGEGIELTIG